MKIYLIKNQGGNIDHSHYATGKDGLEILARNDCRRNNTQMRNVNINMDKGCIYFESSPDGAGFWEYGHCEFIAIENV